MVVGMMFWLLVGCGWHTFGELVDRVAMFCCLTAECNVHHQSAVSYHSQKVALIIKSLE